jgi:hypothetical protein
MLFTAGYGVKQFNCTALLRYQERLSAKKRGAGRTEGAYYLKNESTMPVYRHCGHMICRFSTFSGQQ